MKDSRHLLINKLSLDTQVCCSLTSVMQILFFFCFFVQGLQKVNFENSPSQMLIPLRLAGVASEDRTIFKASLQKILALTRLKAKIRC